MKFCIAVRYTQTFKNSGKTIKMFLFQVTKKALPTGGKMK